MIRLILKRALRGRSLTQRSSLAPVPCCVAGCSNCPEVTLVAWRDAELRSCAMHARLWLASREQRRAKTLRPQQRFALLERWSGNVPREMVTEPRRPALVLLRGAAR